MPNLVDLPAARIFNVLVDGEGPKMFSVYSRDKEALKHILNNCLGNNFGVEDFEADMHEYEKDEDAYAFTFVSEMQDKPLCYWDKSDIEWLIEYLYDNYEVELDIFPQEVFIRLN